MTFTATAKSMNPMPPIHWVNERYTKRLCGSSSGRERMEEPVVVKPLTDSKTASVKEPIQPEKR